MTRCWVCVAAVAAVLVLGLGGCEADRPCNSGATRSCDCPAGGSGTQTCSGGEWGTCTGCTISGGDGGIDAPMDGPGSDADGAGGDAQGDGPAGDSTWSDAIPGTQPWNPMPAPAGMGHTLYAVWGSGPKDIYAAGDNGLVLHFNGRKSAINPWWTQVTTTSSQKIEGLWSSGPNDLFAAALGGSIMRYNGAAWSATTTGTTKAFRSIWGLGFDTIYAGGEFGTLRLNNRSTVPNSWTALKTSNQESYLGIWGSGPNDVFIVGTTGTILHYDGTSWKGQASGTTEHLWGVWGASSKDVYAVGDAGTVVRYDGTTWSKLTSPTGKTLYGVWGSGPKDVFVVGAYGTILHYDGAAFSTKKSGTTWDLRAVWGSGFNDVYAVGEKLTILHFAPCECSLGKRCFQKGDRDDTGCLICAPSKSSTTLMPFSGDCKIGSTCWTKGETDASGCKVCDPTQSTGTWSTKSGGCAIGGVCYASGQQGPVACQSCDPPKSSTAWSQKAGYCQIGAACFKNGAKDSSGCQICDTSKSSTAWSAVAGKCYIAGTCHNSGTKDSSGCLVCDPAQSGTSWSSIGGKCLIGGTCYNAGAMDASGCRTCNAAQNPSDWTVVGGKCYINSTCVNSGVKDSSGCQECNPANDPIGWSAVSGKCFINNVCLNNGAKDSSGCRVCDISKNTFDWTMVAGKCYISGACYSDQQQDATGCNKCDIASSTSVWTPVGCTLGKLTPKKVTFAQGTSSSSLNLSSINTDGTGLAAGGLTGLYFYSAYLYGRATEYYPFTADVPQRLAGLPYYPIRLPAGKGRIHYFRDYTKSQVGVLWVKPSGETQVLYTAAGTSTTSLYYYFAVSDDGTRVATHRPKKGIVLMRTDGLNFSNGKPSLELDATPAPYYIFTTSITLTNDNVYMISRASSSTYSQHTLWSAPVDGSKTTLSAVTLPNVGSTKPVFIDDEIAISPSGTIAITAGGSYSAEDVISVNPAGLAINLTQAPANYEERYYSYGYGSSGSQLALSPDGKYVAYARYASSYKTEVYVRKTDGTGTPIHVTAPSNFSSTYVRAFSFKFADNNTLFFTVYGSSSSYVDLFMLKISTGVVTNVSKTHSSLTKPYTLLSSTYHRPYGMWLSPNKKYLYYLAYRSGSPSYTTDIRGINVATGAIKEVTTGADVYKTYEAFASCAGKSVLYFIAEPTAVSGTLNQVMMFDMNTASKAVALTSLKPPTGYTYNYVYDLTPSPDCSHVAFRAGGTSNKVDVYSVKPGSPTVVARLTDASKATSYHYVYDYMAYSQDSSQLVYLTGTSTSQYQLRANWSTAGPCCPDTLVHAGTGTSKYWLPFGVK
jgi:hypothetical protein